MGRGVELATGYVTLAVETSGLVKQLGAQFKGAEGMAAASGRNMGKAIQKGLDAADGGNLEDLQRKLTENEAKLAAAADQGARKRANAAKQVEIAEARLAEVKAKGNASNSQILAAEARLTTSRQRYTDISKQSLGQVQLYASAVKDSSAKLKAAETANTQLADSADKTKRSFSGFGDSIKKALSGDFKGAFDGLKSSASTAASESKSAITSGLSDAKTSIKSSFSGAFNGVKGDAALAAAGVESEFGQASEGGSSSMLSIFGGAMGKIPALIGAAGIGAAFASAISDGVEQSQLNARLGAQLNLTGPQSKDAGKVAGRLYAGAYGDSMGAVNEALGAVMSSMSGMRDASQADLEKITGYALNLSSAFDVDVNESVGAAGVLMKNGLATDATQAFDLITGAMQKVPAGFRDEIFPAITEYGKHFSNLGISGEQAMSMLVKGAENGTIGVDKMGDAVKEFTIRSTDGSKSTAAAYKDIGLNMDEMTGKLLAGGDSANDAFGQIIAGLRNMKDPSAQSQAALALFGTQMEDLGVDQIPEVLAALDPATAGLEDLGGSAAKMGDQLNDNAGTKVESFKRTLSQGFVNVVAGVITVFEKVYDAVAPVVNFLADTADIWGPFAFGIGLVAAAFGLYAGAGFIAATATTALSVAAGFLGTALAFITSPISLIVIGIGLLVGAIIYAYNNVGWFKDAVNAAFTGIQTVVGAVIGWFASWVVPMFQAALALLGSFFSWMYTTVILPVWNGIQAVVSAFVTWFMTVALPWIQSVIQGIGTVMTWLWVNIIQPVWNGIMVFLTVIIAAIVTIFQGIVWVVRNVLGPVFSWLYNAIILPVWNAIKGAIGAAWASIRDAIFTPLMGFIRGPLTSAWLWIRDTVSQVWGAIRGAVSSSWAWIRDVVLFPLITFLRTTLTNAWLWLRNIVSQVWDAIRGKIAAIWNWVRDNVLNPAIGFLRNTFGPAWNWLRDVIGAAWGRIREMSSAAWNWVRDSVFAPFRGGLDLLKDAFNRTKDGIKTAWDKLKDAVKEPISFVVNSVVNPFLTNYNKINDFWSGKDIDTIKGFARGGVLPGYRASKSDDVMTPMRSGEGVLVPEVVRGLGSGFVHAANRVGNSGGVSAVKRWASEGFAKGGVISPVRGNPGLSQGYTRIHKGIDIAVPEGTPVYATADGVVSHAGPGARAPGVWGGNEVHVRGGGLERWFAHLSQIAVRAGERVKQGQLLGKSGNTGISSGPHLHFGVFQGGWPNDLNPLDYLKGAIAFGPDTGGGGFIDPVGWFMDKLSGAGFDWAGKVKAAKDKFAGNQFAQMGTGIAGKLFDGIKQKAADLASPLLNAADKAIEGGRKVVSGVANNTKLTAWMTEALTKKGMLNPLNLASGIRRAKQESGGDPNVVNNWDSNAKAGTPSKGLMQVIEPTFRQYMEPGHGNILDPVDNILASINYTYATYGSLRRGWDRAGGYALGGIVGESARSIGRSVSGVWDAPVGTVHALRPGVSTIYNGTGSTEMFQRVDTTAAGTSGEAHLHLHGTEYDESRMIRRGAEEWSRAFRKAGVAA